MDKIALEGRLSLSTDKMRSLVILVFTINTSGECPRWDESTRRTLHQAHVFQIIFLQQSFPWWVLDHPESAWLALPTAIRVHNTYLALQH